MECVYKIDQKDIIISTNEDWSEFAHENDYEQNVVGKCLWDFISDDTLVVLWKDLLKHVRKTKRSVILEYRCDASNRKRHMTISIIPGDVIEFRSKLIKEELQEELGIDLTKLIKSCSWCKRLHYKSEWVDIDMYLKVARMFEETKVLPKITHGICPDCAAYLKSIIEE